MMSFQKLLKNTRNRFLLFSSILLLAGFSFSGIQTDASKNLSTAVTANNNSSFNFQAIPESMKGVEKTSSKNCRNAIPNSMDITFQVKGMSGSLKNIELRNLAFDPNFKWGANLSAVLISPDGQVSKTLFGNPDSKTNDCLKTQNLTGSEVTNQAVVLPTQSAQKSNTNRPLDLDKSFAQVNDVNGNWILRLTDPSGGALGAVSKVSLSLATNPTIVAVPTPTPQGLDFNGDGRTDFTILRANSGAGIMSSYDSGSQNYYKSHRLNKHHRSLLNSFVNSNLTTGSSVSWITRINGSNDLTSTENGNADSDIPTPADYDGDLKVDTAVWRPISATEGAFYIFQSSTNTFRIVNFGQDGDEPSVVADYDGDKKADPATFRCPQTTPGPCYFYYLGSNNNPTNSVTVVPWGFGIANEFYTLTGDFDGDGKADFCIQREHPSYPGLAQYVLLRSSDFKYEFINWGLTSDFLIPGDYDGDGKSDFCVVRIETLPNDPHEALSYYILTRTGGGTGTSPIRFGDSNDVPVPGDYDKDGKTDIAVWRDIPDSSDPTPDVSKFFIYQSSNKTLSVYPLGQFGDYPAAAWQIH